MEEIKTTNEAVRGSKYDFNDWNDIEVSLPESERKVIEMLKGLAITGTSNKESYERILDTIDNLYFDLKSDKIITDSICIPINESIIKIKSSKGSKANQIKEKNTLDRLKISVDKFNNNKSWREIPISINNDPIEIKMIYLMYHIEGMIKHIDKISEEEQYDLIFGCSKIINKLETIDVIHKTNKNLLKVSKELIADLKFKYNQFLRICDFDIMTASVNYPKFFIKTSYDKILPGLAIKPYKSQIEVIDAIRNNKESLICLNTLTGEGKTSLIVAIATLALQMRKNNNLEVIYCCSEKLRTVRQQVGQYAYNGIIPFGIAIKDKNNKISISDNWNCKKFKIDRILTIADIESTIELLKENTKDYILVFDEPTVGLDIINSPMVNYLTKIFTYMPKITILASATLPRVLETKFINRNINFIKSNRVQIGSEISDLNGQIYIPHLGCKDYESLEKVINKIEEDGFLQKCYTASIVNSMYILLCRITKTRKIELNDIEDFNKYMIKPGNMNQQTIQNLGMSYLKKVLDISYADNSIIITFCNCKFNKFVVDFDKLASDAEIFENQSLIVTTNPIQFFDNHFMKYIDNITKEINSSFASLYKNYQKEIAIFQQKIEEAKVLPKKLSSIEREKLLEERLNDLDNKKPQIGLPLKYIIGSSEYFEKRNVDNRREFLRPELIDWNTISCQDKHQFGLALGIGILSPKNMSNSYTRKVMELASNGFLAYILADDDICYGTNYPIENVIVDNTCMLQHSVKTIFQVFARAGRPGKSWKANIFAHSDIIKMINDYVFDTNYYDIESINMNIALEALEPLKHDIVLEDKIIENKILEKENNIMNIIQTELSSNNNELSWEEQADML
jgi:hypothetical protein